MKQAVTAVSNPLLGIWNTLPKCGFNIFVPDDKWSVDEVNEVLARHDLPAFDKAKYGTLDDGLSVSLVHFSVRFPCCQRYAWAIPDNAALEVLVRYSPLIEIGAGTGYWAMLAANAGADIVAFDHAPPSTAHNFWHPDSKLFYDVREGRAETVRDYPERTLFLCWPPLNNPMAHLSLLNFQGDTVIYVGEGDGGCTADDAFHEALASDYSEIEIVALPQWFGLHDYLSVWERKKKKHGKRRRK